MQFIGLVAERGIRLDRTRFPARRLPDNDSELGRRRATAFLQGFRSSLAGVPGGVGDDHKVRHS